MHGELPTAKLGLSIQVNRMFVEECGIKTGTNKEIQRIDRNVRAPPILGLPAVWIDTRMKLLGCSWTRIRDWHPKFA